MRIDYSEPRQSYGSGSQRKADSSSSTSLLTIVIVALFIFGAGFGTGWFFSQKAAKKAFRAATEQESLESTPKEIKKLPEQPPTQAAPAPPVATPAGQPPQQASPTGQVPLSFFENLPKGQKQAVLGSGINEKPKPVTPAVAPSQPAATTKSADAKQTASGFIVQVAAFTNQKEAEATKAKLAAKGYSAALSETTINDKIWYRVRIGRHLEKEAATEIASRIGGGAKILPDQE